MAAEPEDTHDPLEALTDEFLQRHRSGEAVDAEAFAREHPAHSEQIRELFPLLLQLEGTRAPEPARAQERIGRWQVVRELGRGGMGVVYLVQDDQTTERAALKLMSADSPEAIVRFRREAEAVSRVEHPGICRVLEVSAADGRLWIAFEYVEGESLADALRRERREREEAGDVSPRDPAPWLDMGRQVALALHAAHEVGLVHRDVKPGNIMLAPEGRAVVLDFGLAHGDADGEQTRITQTGVPIGTPVYMSPEQVRAGSQPLDRRTDVYSLGATIYEALTLEPPFSGPTIASLFSQILATEAAPVRRVAPTLPRDLEVVLATALEKRPERRYATSQALAEDLRRVEAGVRVRARPAGPMRRIAGWAVRHPGAAAAAGSLALALVTGLVVALLLLARVQEARDGERAVARHLRARALVSASIEARRSDAMLALLLAREALQVERSPETISQLHAAVHGSLERVRLEGHGARVLSIAWAARGGRVATGALDGQGRLFDEKGTLLTTVGRDHAKGAVEVALAPSGRFMTTIQRDGTTRLWSDAGQELAQLSAAGEQARVVVFLSDESVAVLRSNGKITVHEPDGSLRASWTVDVTGDTKGSALHSVAATTTPPALHVLTRDMQAISYDARGNETRRRLHAKGAERAQILQGGWLVYVESANESEGTETLSAVDVDGSPAGTIEVRAREARFLYGGDSWWGVWTRSDGAIVARPSSADLPRVTLDMQRSGTPSMVATPDSGSRLFTARKILTGDGGVDPDVDLWRLWTPRGGPLAALTVGENYPEDASFSPDGERIALMSHRGEVATIHATAPVEVATVVPRWRFRAIGRYAAPISGDSNHMVVFDDESHLRVICEDGSTRTRFAVPPCAYLDMLPDKELLLFTERGGAVHSVDLDGTVHMQLPATPPTRRALWVGSEGAFVTGGANSVRFHDPTGKVQVEVPGQLLLAVPQRNHEDEVAVATTDKVVVYGSGGKELRELALSDGERPHWYCGSTGGRSVLAMRTGRVKAIFRCSDKHGQTLWQAPVQGVGHQTALISRDGRRTVSLASGGLSLRDAGNGDEVAHLSIPGGVSSVEFGRDSKRVFAGSQSGHVRVWDLDGNRLFDLPNQGGSCVAHISRDGRRLAVATKTMVRLFTTDTDELLALAKRRSTREFSEAERARFADILEPLR